jgi:uncharacterized membrane protein YraQ (UPF0718 family)
VPFLSGIVAEFWAILVDSGWWLLIGFVLGGLVHALVPMSAVRRHLGRRGFVASLKAAAIGVPLPLCSCSVIPTAAALRRSGASRGASASFAIATPEADAPSVMLSWVLLGPMLAIVRPIAALITGVLAGVLIDATDRAPADPPPSGTACASCCCTGDVDAPRGLRSVIRYSLIDLPQDLAPWLLGGLVLSSVLAAALPEGWLADHVGSGFLPMLLMLVIGVPMYICATASTPVAAVLIAKGLSPGAALVLLLVGPATNVATMAWVVKDLGARALAVYLIVVAGVALGLGVALDASIDLLPGFVAGVAPISGDHGAGLAGQIGGAVLLALLVFGLVRHALARARRLKRNRGSARDHSVGSP